MKILQINSVYKYGSTGKIVADIHSELLRQGYGSVVCYGRRKKPSEPFVHKVSTELEGKIHSVMSRLFGVDFGYSWFATSRTIRIIKRERPDVVHLHCLNGHFINAYRLVDFLKRHHIPTVLTLHAEIMHTAGCDHAMECEKWKTECHGCSRISGLISGHFRDDARYCFRKMKKAFDGFGDDLIVVGVSDWLTERAKQSPIFRDNRFMTVHNGIDNEVFIRKDAASLRRRLGIPDGKKIVLHVTPNFNHVLKGGQYVLELAERFPECQFIIVGFNGQKELLPANVLPISHTQNQAELAEYYSMADVTVLTSKRETFSMVCVESLCCGTPIVGFEAGGPETISLPAYSHFVENGNTEALERCVREFLSKDFPRSDISEEARRVYSKKNMSDTYIRECYERK